MNPCLPTRLSLRRRYALVTAAWCITVAAASGALLWSERQPGTAGLTPVTAPAWLAGRPRHSTLVVALHPRCTCSRATLANLKRLLGDDPSCSIVALVYRPQSQPAAWADEARQQLQQSLPGARTVDDPDGALAAQLGARTSGHVVLYSPGGRLLFSGGVTASRGHEGDNDALQTLGTLVANAAAASPYAAGASAPPTVTTVFGCPLCAADDGVCAPDPTTR